ncbi:lasso RiPP family leader peptide-containing protein [Streptomyces olivoreticuli]|nr:lasso RiPP family leader peptide-containing protein [Streptomyces olivoreticuli]
MDADKPVGEAPEVYLPPALTDMGDFADVTLGHGYVEEDSRDNQAW